MCRCSYGEIKFYEKAVNAEQSLVNILIVSVIFSGLQDREILWRQDMSQAFCHNTRGNYRRAIEKTVIEPMVAISITPW